jgi:hypothetical protein
MILLRVNAGLFALTFEEAANRRVCRFVISRLLDFVALITKLHEVTPAVAFLKQKITK